MVSLYIPLISIKKNTVVLKPYYHKELNPHAPRLLPLDNPEYHILSTNKHN